MKRVSTGIKGLDTMLKGGLIAGRTYLVKGCAGAGKTILSTQFLVEGARRGEKVIYVTIEESIDEIVENMKSLDIDVNGIKFVDASPTGESSVFAGMFVDVDVQALKSLLEAKFEEKPPKRLVIDSVTMLRLAKSELEYRRDLLVLMSLLKKYGITSIITSDVYERSIEDYLVSGVIELQTIEFRGRILRGVRITKFRGSDFDENVRPYRIGRGGIEVYADLNLFEKR